MKLAHFIALLLVAVVALALGTGLLSQQKGQQTLEQQTFINDLDFTNVHQLIIKDSQQQVVINKHLAQWQVEQVYGYKADTVALSKLLQQFKDAQVQELKTSNSKNYHRLGLSDINQDNSESMLVTLKSGEQVIELLLGSHAKSGTGQYAKFLAQAQTVLLDTSFSIKTSPGSWLEKDILDINFDTVRSLSWQSEQAIDFVVTRAELAATGELKEKGGQPNLPQGEIELEPEFSLIQPDSTAPPQYPSIFSGLVRNTVQLELQSVIPFEQFAKQGLVTQFSIELNTVEQSVKQQSVLRFFQHQDTYWLTVSGANWAYKISEFSFKQLAKPLAEYLQN